LQGCGKASLAICKASISKNGKHCFVTLLKDDNNEYYTIAKLAFIAKANQLLFASRKWQMDGDEMKTLETFLGLSSKGRTTLSGIRSIFVRMKKRYLRKLLV